MKVNATLSKTIEAMKNEMISRDELNKKSKNLSSKLDQKGRTSVDVAHEKLLKKEIIKSWNDLICFIVKEKIFLI